MALPNRPEPAISLHSARSLAQLTSEFGGSTNKPSAEVLDVAAPEHASIQSLVPILHPGSIKNLHRAAAVLVDPSLASRIQHHARWEHPFPRFALARLLSSLEDPVANQPSISPHAIIEPNVTLGHRVTIGHGAVLLAGASIGNDTIVSPRAVIYGSTFVGDRVVIGAGAVIGRPGFGWAQGPDGTTIRMPQLGGVVIEDDVEIGPLATIDAGTLHPTRLRSGCKLDAQVHVGHNVDIGEATFIAAQSGFAGSSTIGHHVLIGGQVGVADHVTIGNHAQLAGRSGVIGSIPPHAKVAGYPAVDRMRWLRAVAKLMRGKP